VVGVNRWKSKPQRLKPSRLDDNYGKLLVFIDQVISHRASDFPVLCEILRESHATHENRSPASVWKPQSQHNFQVFRPLDMFVLLSCWKQRPLGFIEILDPTILSGCKRKIVKGRSVLPRRSKRFFYLQRYL